MFYFIVLCCLIQLLISGIKFSWISLSFLYMIIYEVLYTWCLRYNIWSAWSLDIRLSTCFQSGMYRIASYSYFYKVITIKW